MEGAKSLYRRSIRALSAGLAGYQMMTSLPEILEQNTAQELGNKRELTIKQGYLFVKKSGSTSLFNNWKKRWVVVKAESTKVAVGERKPVETTNCLLNCYNCCSEGATSRIPVLSVPVSSNYVIVVIEKENKNKHVHSDAHFSFVLVGMDNSPVVFAVDSEDARREWISMLDRVTKKDDMDQLLAHTPNQAESTVVQATYDSFRILASRATNTDISYTVSERMQLRKLIKINEQKRTQRIYDSIERKANQHRELCLCGLVLSMDLADIVLGYLRYHEIQTLAACNTIARRLCLQYLERTLSRPIRITFKKSSLARSSLSFRESIYDDDDNNRNNNNNSIRFTPVHAIQATLLDRCNEFVGADPEKDLMPLAQIFCDPALLLEYYLNPDLTRPLELMGRLSDLHERLSKQSEMSALGDIDHPLQWIKVEQAQPFNELRQMVKIKIILLETCKESRKITGRRFLSPIITKWPIEKTLRKLHCVVMFGPWILEWNKASLVVPRKCFSFATTAVNDLMLPGLIKRVDLQEGLEKLASLVAKWNATETYDKHTRNCQHFAEYIWKGFGFDMPNKTEPLTSVMRLLREHGECDMVLPVSENLANICDLDKGSVARITSHAQLDLMVKTLIDNYPLFSDTHRQEWDLLMCFDRVFWSHYYRDTDFVSGDEFHKDETYGPHDNDCPFKDPLTPQAYGKYGGFW